MASGAPDDPDDLPSQTALDAWVAAARTGAGTPWLQARHAETLARHAMGRGLGISLMEASTRRFTEPPRDTSWEILGADPPGENWDDHRDPSRAYTLFLAKIRAAQRDGVVLQYKIWLAKAD
ncbi:hypothetical protein KUH32_07320 [Thalassococcus sp. CAU 1522]|uniref:Uncharacterized protein n=1 Tax=Thalassococcus arenae TaxID=2851652 RepID=A0ABS6N710_9RHOB|nr:hypothetical protein [Thalassococcus arenae]MBV2359578.1 hypothetical protein [Thalassococcus arenae]